MVASHLEEDGLTVLYDAAYTGSVSTLNSLLQKQPLILYEISQSAFSKTPLHISALLGHLEFTKALLTFKPKLALELDSSQSTALHLASAEGHVEIVKELLENNKEPCLFLDEEGRIPLHYAVMRGRVEVVRELIQAKPESLSFSDNGNSIFHLCVAYNHLETLKVLVELELAITGKLLNFASFDAVGNTIIHLAIKLEKVETMRYLLCIPKMGEVASLKNDMGFTAYDILNLSPKNFKILEIQLMLMNAGIKTEKKALDVYSHQPPPSTTAQVVDDPAAKSRKRNWFIKNLKWIGKWFKHKGDWLEEMRGNLSLVSTVIATITFQAVISPPGGFIQQGLSGDNGTLSSNTSLNCTILSDNNTFCPGEAITSFRYPFPFLEYMICNTISFISSLGVTLLLVSGVRLKNKVVIWLLCIGMCITLTSLASAYVLALMMVLPGHILSQEPALVTIVFSLLAWAGLLGLIILLISLRFLVWLVKKGIKIIKKISRCFIDAN